MPCERPCIARTRRFLSGLARESGHDSTESDVGSDQGSVPSIAMSFWPSDAITSQSKEHKHFQELLAGNWRHQDGAGSQDCEGSGTRGSGKSRYCLTSETVDPVCDPVRPLVIMPDEEGPEEHAENDLG